MIKEVVVFIFGIFLITILCYNANAVIGVSPGSYIVDFEPNLEKNFNFNFIFDADAKAELYVEGDLSNYTKLDKKSLIGGGGVAVFLKLPSYIEVPGVHIIFVGARQLPGGEGIGIVGNVRGVIKVKVPYPGKYAEITLTTANVNAGDPIELKVIVNNLGNDNITAATSINIYNSEGGYIENLNLGSKFIETKKSEEFFMQLNTSNYKAGDYKAMAIVNYDGKTALAEAVFRLGELYVGILNYTREFERNKINRIEIEAESFWNDPIENLYSNVKIINYNIDFNTPSIHLNPWSKVILNGFFDATPIKEDEFRANITLHYSGRTTNQIVDLRFKKETNYMLYAIISAVAIMFVILVIVIIILLRRTKKSGKKKK